MVTRPGGRENRPSFLCGRSISDSGEWAGKTGGWPVFLNRTDRSIYCKNLPGRPAAALRRCGQSPAPRRFRGRRRSGTSCRLRRKSCIARIIILVLPYGHSLSDSGERARKTDCWPVFLTWKERAPHFAENAPERPSCADSGRIRRRRPATGRAGGPATGIGRKRRPRGGPGTVRALTGTDIGERAGVSRKKIK